MANQRKNAARALIVILTLWWSLGNFPLFPVKQASAASTTNGTTWYLRSTTASTAFSTTGPVGEQSAASDLVSGSPANKTTALAMTDSPGTSQVTVAGTETSASAGNVWFRTFLSPKLASQTINTGTTFRLEGALAENSNSANMILRIHVFQWREGTGNIASLIDNVSATACGVEPGAAGSERSQICVTAGTASNATINANDQLALEVWVNANNTATTSFTGTLYMEGNGFIGNSSASHVVSSAMSSFRVSQNLVLASATTNATTWYLRSTTASTAFSTTGPVGEQSAASDLVSGSPANKTTALAMTDSPGTSQVTVAGTETSASAGNVWFRTFLSPKLASQTINTGTTFRLEGALAENSNSANMILRIHVFQWREGTGNIASLIDNVSATACGVEPGAAGSERSQICVTAGTASNATINANDQLALEVWVNANNTATTSFTGTLYMEGNGFLEDGTASHVASSAMSNLTISTVLALASAGGGSLSVDIVDAGDASVSSPSVAFSSLSYSFDSQTSTGTLGISSQKIRVSNTTATATWTLTIAATGGATATWSAGTPKYDYNDGSGSSDGGDTDSYGGQLTIDASAGTLAAVSPCSSTTDITKGSSALFQETAPIVSSITLLTAGSSASTSCSWDFTGVSLSQAVPASQGSGTYTLSFTLTAA